jgi:2-hydroxy-6-oxonona-2,4-dienedioate hydrolase
MKRRMIALAFSAALASVWLTIVALSGTAVKQRQTKLSEVMRTADLPSGTIAYADQGTGSALLALHGAGGGFDQGLLMAEAFANEGRRIIAVSRFGYPGSPLPPDASVTAQAAALSQLLDALNIDQVDILAMSGGVPPALKFAELYPTRTRRLALLSSAPIEPSQIKESERPLPTSAYQYLLGNNAIYWSLTVCARGTLASAFDARPELLTHASSSETRFVSRLIDDFLPAKARLPGLANEGAAIDPRADYALESIDAPALILHARDDRMNAVAIAESLGERLPKANLVLYDTGGHLLLGYHADARDEIARFLDEDS